MRYILYSDKIRSSLIRQAPVGMIVFIVRLLLVVFGFIYAVASVTLIYLVIVARDSPILERLIVDFVGILCLYVACILFTLLIDSYFNDRNNSNNEEEEVDPSQIV